MTELTPASAYPLDCHLRGASLCRSDRSGKGNNNFKMPKFYSMSIDTLTLGTYSIGNPYSPHDTCC